MLQCVTVGIIHPCCFFYCRLFLVKHLCRSYGIDVYQALCNSQVPCLRWVQIKELNRNQVKFKKAVNTEKKDSIAAISLELQKYFGIGSSINAKCTIGDHK